MKKSVMKKDSLLNLINNMLIVLPSPINLNIFWNFGSLLGLCIIIQILTGLFLSMHYVANVNLSFFSIIHLMNDVNYGWLIRLIHMNGASMFFICIYLHIGRGLYYQSYKLKKTWNIGVLLLLILMMTAFLGYVLPWGQMSFWGATVITNLLSVVPYFGVSLVEWLWGGFSVNNNTLMRFYSFHFLFPFILVVFIIIHLIYLHDLGSNNPLGLKSNYYKIIFHNYYSIKDLMGMMILLMILLIVVFLNPYMLGDSENFLEANSLVTPVHIQPEWYFLFAYTILRCISNKLLGVLFLFFSILILLILPFLKLNKFQSLSFYPINQILFWMFFNIMLMLTWLGMQVVEYPFIFLSQFYMLIYFLYYLLDYYFKLFWDYLN
nr:cytochrome b [Chelonus formosanus]UDP58203.1 cytochrome b [Chelonus formosanus]UHY94337.1 cytochrome b [Chelonus formosanus]UJM44018.1 cytochrome b [Chelonus formosanus]